SGEGSRRDAVIVEVPHPRNPAAQGENSIVERKGSVCSQAQFATPDRFLPGCIVECIGILTTADLFSIGRQVEADDLPGGIGCNPHPWRVETITGFQTARPCVGVITGL